MLYNKFLKESLDRIGMEVSLLERPQARLNWLIQQQNNCHDFQNNQTQLFPLHEVDSGNDMPSFGDLMVPSGMKHFLSWNAEEATRMKEGKCEDAALVNNLESVDSRSSFKKRKAETMIVEKSTETCIKVDAEEESKDTEKSCKETSADISKGISEHPEVKKPDYIHVRARRGQATDSHSLAERARREKISKKMKCLQDLVPGCDKAMGKAGMLDEIINYVQSLQRQVEFLSMKLAALNPQADIQLNELLPKEFPVCVSNFQATTSSPVMASLAFSQGNSGQQETPSSNLDISHLTNSTQEAYQQISRSSMPFPKLYLDPTYLQHVQQLPMCNPDVPRLFHGGFQ